MTGKSTKSAAPAKTAGQKDPAAEAKKQAAKASVQEAIGTLLGDDTAKAKGRAGKRAGAAGASAEDTTKPPQA